VRTWISIILGLPASAALAAAPAPPAQGSFEAAAGDYAACMTAVVRMGMTTKVDPDAFRTGLQKACPAEEARFRAAAIAQARALGRSDADAATEVDGNIARAKAAWAADEATYLRTGHVPR
jgi:hypothetical protein